MTSSTETKPNETPPEQHGSRPVVSLSPPVVSRRVIELPVPPKADILPTVETPAIDASPGDAEETWLIALRRQLTSGFVISFTFHFVLILAMALIFVGGVDTGRGRIELDSGVETPELRLLEDDLPTLQMPEVTPELATVEPVDLQVDITDLVPQPDVPRAETESPTVGHTAISIYESYVPKFIEGGGLEGRGAQVRAKRVAEGGGTPASETAVDRGLKWLAAHQRANGSWGFDLSKEPCLGQCSGSGTKVTSTGSTAVVLLAFLGRGNTHESGEYHETVQRGLYYLSTRALKTEHGLDFREGTMYSQALVAIAFCEAYAMTKDETLRGYAQGAIDFIVYAQNKPGGGWRYSPGEPGDMTVTGWQLMALKSAKMAGLEVPSPVLMLLPRFLKSLQCDYGAQYGYRDASEPRQSTTAIGLLCRMYLGWRPGEPALDRGIRYLAEWGPEKDEIYYNYYANQVLFHYKSPAWTEWNEKMREELIASQSTTGHEAGSWLFKDDQGTGAGGRVYCTALAVMTLEVYYRYMPLYQEKTVLGDSF